MQIYINCVIIKIWKKTKNIKTSNKIIKKNAKASVFTHLFNISKYRKELYVSLHPKEKNIKEEDIKTWTLTSVFTNIQVNDLGILVKDKILVLVEAQSIWTLNILPRMLEYLAESYNRYIIETNQNIYGTKKVTLPKPELYVLYTGEKNINKREISFKKEFYGNKSPVEIKAKVITVKNSSKILSEYIKFTKIFDKNTKLNGYTKESIEKTIEYCIDKDILREYLIEKRKEVYNIMISVYDQKTATDMYGREQYAEGMKKGRSEGIERGKSDSILFALKKNYITIENAANVLNISKAKLEQMMKE